ncbi:hypothetical protein NL676_016367 [Syzygium grande]|nr:hypothetical protein NL676_016367 [Syzygium grande]
MQNREPEGLIHGVQDSMVLKEKSHLVLEAKTCEKKSHNVPEADMSFKPSSNGARGGDGRGDMPEPKARECVFRRRERE